MSNMDNICLLTDSYKVTHWKQYPPKTQIVYSYLESRGGEFDKVMFFGLQYILEKYLSTPITQENIDIAADYWQKHFNNSNMFNKAGWEYILEHHGGYLPILICAVPEGTIMNSHNVLMTIENTDENVPWLTNWLETILMQVWYPCTVATQSHAMKEILLSFLKINGTPELVDFKLHDFGFRGVSSVETAGIGGCAHLVNFKGTDTAAGFLVANEHSTITSWGKENELDAYANMLQAYPNGLVAVVSDSYDIYNAVKVLWGQKLKDQVLARDGCLIIRPDSGNPLEVISELLTSLAQSFGFTINDKGYGVLNDKVRLIQGDGIDIHTLYDILKMMHDKGWSADNIAFGSGGALLQKLNRDTCKFAIKCSAIKIDNVWKDVYKDPITDKGKKSKAGRFSVIKGLNEFVTVHYDSDINDILRPVYKNGSILRYDTLSNIRKTAENK